MSSSSCSSRHSRRSRAATPGGSSCWTACSTCSTRSGVVGGSNVEAISRSETGRSSSFSFRRPRCPVRSTNEMMCSARALSGVRQLQVGELLGQVVLQRLRPLDDVLHRVELAVAQLVQGSPARPVLVLVECPVPVAVEGLQPLELQLGPGVGRVVLERGLRVELLVRRRPVRLGRSAARPRPRPLRPTPPPWPGPYLSIRGPGSLAIPSRCAPAGRRWAAAGSPSTGSCAGRGPA